MSNYSEKLREHLGPYKRYRLGVNEDGLSRGGFKHGYILPETYQRLNILETYRQEFWLCFDDPSTPRDTFSLQPGFHQLDSTQAMCFNLFIPFVHDPAVCDLLLRALGREPEPVASLRYDGLIDRADMLRGDFFVALASGTTVAFEMKLAEESFNSVLKPTPGQTKRLREIHAPRLHGKVPEIYLRETNFFRFDHIMRNIAMLETERGDHLYIVFPKANAALASQQVDIEAMCSVFLKDYVTILYLDDLVRRILASAAGQSPRFLAHFEMLKEKYLLS